MNNQVYNVERSAAWTMVVPKNGMVEGGGRIDQAQKWTGQRVTVMWVEPGKPLTTIVVKNVPYSSAWFKTAKHSSDLIPISVPYRAMLIKGETNWPPGDSVLPRFVKLTYDYGVPVVAKR